MADRHQEIERLIDEYVDGTLDDLRARAVRGHLRDCQRCAERALDTEQFVQSASQMPSFEPPGDLWQKLSARIDDDERALAGHGRFWWWWHGLGRRFIAGTGVLVLASVTAWFAFHGRQPLAPALEAVRLAKAPEVMYEDALAEVGRAQVEYQSAVNDLRRLALSERPRWSPEAQRLFDENLAAIDGAVARQAELARAHPGDVLVADALAESYGRQIGFLQDAVVRGDGR